MDIKGVINSAIELAKAGAVVFPSLANGAELAEKVVDVLDGLSQSAPTQGSKEEIEAAHRELYDAMMAKGRALSDRLRG